ncbi:Gfo/Idh/MocA family protein [Streptomonospora wellingtoniae]|uniref:Gfo/Idh/MocA family oxidoreductase n=1 Tax=Streptomonospora wellingtoniae TaxID=3075544 RepID=A0ABU2KTQ5_9ACTN|nr:Gfo/Idh/MocA family oxidoreductase [Streptomonospora sp. DSM 45055]MDT0302680.1 Gfo/Idh/MocA family oxidoreductase [Streptomonospora sp. DSM 45055]
MSEAPVPVVLAGAHGHGRSHLRNVRTLAEEGLVRLVGVCDRVPLPASELADHPGAEQSADLGGLLRRTGAAATILCTPIHTHLPLARAALDAGSHLLLEKPPAATAAEFRALRDAVSASGLACQIGFQSLGSAAIGAVRSLVADGAVGEVRGIGGAGTWVRTSEYYARAEWAGRRRIGGLDVVDGALTNPFAHAVATALAVAGAQRETAEDIELELFHAHEIEGDDTSCMRLRTSAGVPVSIAVTLCAATHRPPRLVVHGDAGRITLFYTLDQVRLERPGREPETSVHPRTDLLRNLVAHLHGEAPLLVPPEETAGFTAVLDAVRRAPAPLPIPPALQRVTASDGGVQRVVAGVDDLVALSAERVALFSELAAPWAAPGASGASAASRAGAAPDGGGG